MDLLTSADLLRWLGACLILAVLLGGFALALKYWHGLRGYLTPFTQHTTRPPRRLLLAETLPLTVRHKLFLVQDAASGAEHLLLLSNTGEAQVLSHAASPPAAVPAPPKHKGK